MPPSELRLDFAFTERDTPALRARIERALARIALVTRGSDPHLRALVLTGGFSRGEGTARDGAPVNDYDLVAIRDHPGGDALYARLGAQVSDELAFPVDLLPVWIERLPFVGRKIFWLDLRLGGRVIAGEKAALARVRPIQPERIEHAEIARLLGNRAAGMILSLPGQGERVDVGQRDLQATKAVLAAMDAELLSHGRYAPRVRERLAMTRHHPDHEAFRLAVEWKLRQEAPLPPDWWEQARDVLLRAVDETEARMAQDGLLEHALHALRARRVRPSPSQAVRRAAWDLLALSRFPEGPTDLPSASRTLRALGLAAPPSDWSALKRSFLHARGRTLQ